MTHSSLLIQITPESTPSPPSWLGEVAVVAQVLKHTGLLKAIQDHVQFARARFGHYDTLDFVVVLIGYALSGEPTLKAFYERLLPFAEPFMALFGRQFLPSRSALSRFLAALDQATVEALRTLFQVDLVARSPFASAGGLWDRFDQQYVVVDVDGTKQAARQRALPQLPSLPSPHRRFDQVCAPGYKGRKRGEVVRTRTTILQAHTHQFLGTFGGAGNGDYREELRTSSAGDHQVCDDAKASPLPDAGASGWLVWQRRRAQRCPGHGSGHHRAQSRLCSPGSGRGPGGSGMPPR